MEEKEIKQYLKENLRINVNSTTSGIQVTLLIEGEEIDSDYINGSEINDAIQYNMD